MTRKEFEEQQAKRRREESQQRKQYETRQTVARMGGEDALNEIAADIYESSLALVKGGDGLRADYNKRYGNGGTAYRSDSAEWLNHVSNYQNGFNSEYQRVSKLLDDYGKLFDKEWINNIRNGLSETRNLVSGVSASAEEDRAYWKQFKDEKDYETARKNNEAYNDWLNYDESAAYERISKYEGLVNDYNTARGASSGSNYNNVADVEDYIAQYQAKLDEDYKYGRISPQEYDAKKARSRDDATAEWEASRISEDNKIFEDAGFKDYYDITNAIADEKQKIKYSRRVKRHNELVTAATNAADFEQYAAIGNTDANPVVEQRNEYERVATDGYGTTVMGVPVTLHGQAAQDAYEENAGLGDRVYHYMTPDELKVYNYYWAKEREGLVPKGTADEYLYMVEEGLEGKHAQKRYEMIKGSAFAEILFGIEAGFNQFATGMKNIFNTEDDYINTNATQQLAQLVREDLSERGGFAKTAFDLTQTVSNMIPSIGASYIANYFAPGSGAWVGSILMGTSAAGNAYAEALNSGMDKSQARVYSTLVGISETTLQRMFGGIPGLGGTLTGKVVEKAGSAITKFAAGINNTFGRIALKTGGWFVGRIGSALGETVEEFSQDVLEPYLKAFATGELSEDVDWEQALYSGLLGGLSSLVLGAPGDVASRTVATIEANNIKKNGRVEDLRTVGNTFDAETVAYKLTENLGENPSVLKMAELLREIKANIGEQTATDIKNGLIERGMLEKDAENMAGWVARIVNTDEIATPQQRRVLETNDVLQDVMLDVIWNQNSTYNQRRSALANAQMPRGQNVSYGRDLGAERNATEVANDYAAALNKRADMERRANYERTANEGYMDNAVGEAVKAVRQKNNAVDEAVSENAPSVAKVESVDNGKLNLKYADGSQAAVSEAKFNTSEQAERYLYAQDTVDNLAKRGVNLSAQDVNFIVNAYSPTTGISPEAYFVGAESAIMYGYYGAKPDAGKNALYDDLTTTQQNMLYGIGEQLAAREREARVASRDRRVAAATSKRTGKAKVNTDNVSATWSDGTKIAKARSSMEKNTIDLATKMTDSGAFKNDIVFYRTENGKFVSDVVYNGETIWKKGEKAPNGMHRSSDGTIFVDLAAGNNGEGFAIQTLMHEIGHDIADTNPEAWAQIVDFYKQTVGVERFDSLVSSKYDSMVSGGKYSSVSRDMAIEDVVCDGLGDMATKGDFVEKLNQYTAENFQNEAEAKKFIQKVKDLFNRVLEALRKIYNAVSGTPAAAEISDNIEAVKKIADMAAKAYVEANEARAAMYNLTPEQRANLAKEGLTVSDGVVIGENLAELMETEGFEKPMDLTDPLSARTEPIWEKSVIEQFGDTEETHRYIDAVRNFTDMMVKDDAVREIVPMGSYQYDKYGPLRSNVEYIITFDMDTSCPRTFYFLNRVKRLERIAGRKLNYNERINLLELMRARGDMIPCSYCYVENKRTLLSASYNNWFAFRNDVMSTKSKAAAMKKMYGYNKKKGTLTKASADVFDKWRSDMSYNPTIEEIWGAVNTARNSVFNYLDSVYPEDWVDLKNPKAPSTAPEVTGQDLLKKVGDHFGIQMKFDKNGAIIGENRGAVTEIDGFVAEWLYDKMAGKEHNYITENDPSVSEIDVRALETDDEAMRYAKSASSAKSVENYTPYTDQLRNISEAVKQYIIGMGGIRKHSSNDFRIDYVQDYFMFYADLAMQGWTGHTYTKSVDFAKIFGRTGDRINMSIAMYEDADGNIWMNEDEGANWDEVKKLRKAYKDIGSMAMVTSDNQLSFALNADWIDMIIPFHASGLDKRVWNDLRAWFNYTSTQSERYYNTNEMKLAIMQKALADAGVEYSTEEFNKAMLDLAKENGAGTGSKKTSSIFTAQRKRLAAIAKANGVKLPSFDGVSAAGVEEMYNNALGIKVAYKTEGKDAGKRHRPHFLPGDTVVDGVFVPGHHNDVELYKRLCREWGVKPRFDGVAVTNANGETINVTDHPGYIKLIKETSRTDSPQEKIKFNFDEKDDFLGMSPFEYAMKRLQEEASLDPTLAKYEDDQFGVVDTFNKEYLDYKKKTGKDRPIGWLPDMVKNTRDMNAEYQHDALAEDSLPMYNALTQPTNRTAREREGMLSEREEAVKQAISSAKTSIKQVPALFNNPNVEFGKTNVDIGGGRFDLATQQLAENGTRNYIFDPFNRSEASNKATLNFIKKSGGADTVTCANVLNVIAEPEARANVILEAAKAIKPDGTAYFMVYEGDGKGVGKETSAGWQNNRTTADYVSEIEQYFGDVTRKGRLIIATDPQTNGEKAYWQFSPESDNGEMYSIRTNDGDVTRGILIDDSDFAYSNAIKSGLKKGETRPNLNGFLNNAYKSGERIALIRNGVKGKFAAYATTQIGKPEWISAKDWESRRDDTRVPKGSKYDINGAEGKWYFPFVNLKVLPKEIAPTTHSQSYGRFDGNFSDRDVGYHAGDLGKSESLGQQSGGRGTGHFGTGTYFVGNKEVLKGYNARNGAEAPVEAVDFSKYNLFKPANYKQGMALHEFLKGVNNYFDRPTTRVKSVAEYERVQNEFEDLIQNDFENAKEFEDAMRLAESLIGTYRVNELISKQIEGAGFVTNAALLDIMDGNDKQLSVKQIFSQVADMNRLLQDLYKSINEWSYKSNVDSYESYITSIPEVAKMLGVTPEAVEDILTQVSDEINREGLRYPESYTADSASTRFMKALGYEGVDVRGIDGLDNTKYGSVIYDLKGEDLARKKEIGTARFSDRDYAPVWYSNMSRVIDGIKMEKVGANGVIPYLKGRGVKDEEIKWSGLATFLEGKKSVTKAELRQFAQDSMLKIEEEMLVDENRDLVEEYAWRSAQLIYNALYGGEDVDDDVANVYETKYPDLDSWTISDIRAETQEALENVSIEGQDYEAALREAMDAVREAVAAVDLGGVMIGSVRIKSVIARAVRTAESRADVRDAVDSALEDTDVPPKVREAFKKTKDGFIEQLYYAAEKYYDLKHRVLNGEEAAFFEDARRDESYELPHYRTYTLDGGENYRELLFKMPGSEFYNIAMQRHWDKAGVLAHARMQDLLTEEGRKMLFVEEIQSDWHNEGTNEGYRSADYEAEYQKVRSDVSAAVDAYNKQYDKAAADRNSVVFALGRLLRSEEGQRLREAYAEIRAAADVAHGVDESTAAARKTDYASVPYFNNITNTLAKNRTSTDYFTATQTAEDIPRWAVDAGVGDTLVKVLKLKIEEEKLWNKADSIMDKINEEKTRLEKYTNLVPDAPFRNNYTDFVMKRLLRIAAEEGYDSIGWTTAEQQVERWREQYREGYRIEYDQDIPKFMRKYGKQWGGEVTQTELENGETVWQFVIPDAMKKSILTEGQPMFSDRDESAPTNRELLTNALESTTTDPKERAVLNEYRDRIEKLNSIEAELKQVRTEIKDATFTEGPRDQAKLKKLNAKAKRLEGQLNYWDKRLMTAIETSQPLRDVLYRERGRAYQRAKEADRKMQTARREGRAKTMLRNSIKRTVKKLNTLLKNGSKKTNVKSGLRDTVERALQTANVLFSELTAEDVLMSNITGLKDAERANLTRYQELKYKAMLNEETSTLKDDEIAKNNAEMKRLESKLHDVIVRERARLQEATVSTAIEELATAYETISRSNRNYESGAYDPNVVERLRSLKEALSGTTVRDMSLDQLDAVRDAYRMVLHTVMNANKIFRDGKAEEVSTNAKAVIDEVIDEHELKDERLGITNKVLTAMWNELKPLYAFEAIGSDTLTHAFSDILKGESTWGTDIREAREYATQMREKYNYRNWDMKERHELKLSSGKEVSLTLEQLMSIYAYSKREQALNHMATGGFAIEAPYKKRGVWHDPSKAKTFALNPADLANIRELIDEQADYVDEMQDYLSTVMGAKGNEASNLLYGIDLFKEQFYFPLKSSRDYKQAQTVAAGEASLKNSGMTKETVPHASNPIILEDFDDVWANHVAQMATYHSFVVPIENFNKIYNYADYFTEGEDSMSVRSILRSAFGNGVGEYISKLITDINGGVQTDKVTNPLINLVGKFKKTAVAASLSVIVQQPTAIIRAFSMVNPKYFIPDLKMKHGEKWNQLKKYAPVAVIKEIGGFDVSGFGRQATAYLSDTKTAMEKIDDVTMRGAAFADELGWNLIWDAVKREVADKQGLSGEELLVEAGKRFTDVVQATQVYDSTLSRSAYMRGKSDILKMATAFMGEPTTSINMLANAVIQAKRGTITAAQAASTIVSVITSIVAANALKSLIGGARNDDDEKSLLEKYVKALTANLSDDLFIPNMLPFMRDITSLIEGWDVERTDMALISDIISGIKALSNDNKTTYRKIEEFGGAIANLFGIPARNILRDMRGIYQAASDIMSGQPTTAQGLAEAFKEGIIFFGEETKKSDSVYNAVMSGDSAMLDRLKKTFKDESSYHTALRKGLRDNDSRIRDAAKAKISGDIGGYMRIVKEIRGERKFAQDDIVAAVNSEVTALQKEQTPEAEEQTPWYENESVDEPSSIYKVADINTALANGDMKTAKEGIDDLVSVKKANGMTEKEAMSSVRSGLTSYWKPIYLASSETRKGEIRKMLKETGVYGSADDVVKTTKKWEKE